MHESLITKSYSQARPAVVLAVGGMEIVPIEADEPHRGAAFDGDGLLIGQRKACPPGVDRVVAS